MTDSIPSLLQLAYSPELFEQVAGRWRDLLSDHLRALSESRGKVLHWKDPYESIHDASAWMMPANVTPVNATLPAEPSTSTPLSAMTSAIPQLAERMGDILQKIISSGQNLHHPHYIGHQVPASVPLAGLFDAVSSVTNQVMAIYEMGPWATAVEHALVGELCRKVGWDPEHSTGLLTHGGSLANLTALLTARNISLPGSWEDGVPANAVLVTHPDAHYCVTRSAGILGLGSRQVMKAACDADGHMDPAALDVQLQCLHTDGHKVMAVSACACSTPTGAFDDLTRIADVCEKHGVWLHVDAAHGGGLLMSRQYRSRLAGIDRADSLVWDAHKMLFVPALCAAVLYKNRKHRFETFQQNAPYLFDPSAPGMADIDSGMRTIECTKRATGFGLWGLWSLFGDRIFEELVDRTMLLAKTFHEMLSDAPDFEPLHVPECNIVAFRYTPPSMMNASPQEQDAFQREIRTKLIRSGEFYIVQTTLRDRAALRVCMMNPMTTVTDLHELLQAIRKMAL
jgi:L-2,4-diaminobutyrate decarboxylase